MDPTIGSVTVDPASIITEFIRDLMESDPTMLRVLLLLSGAPGTAMFGGDSRYTSEK